jgi:hypothetical protein
MTNNQCASYRTLNAADPTQGPAIVVSSHYGTYTTPWTDDEIVGILSDGWRIDQDTTLRVNSDGMGVRAISHWEASRLGQRDAIRYELRVKW